MKKAHFEIAIIFFFFCYNIVSLISLSFTLKFVYKLEQQRGLEDGIVFLFF